MLTGPVGILHDADANTTPDDWRYGIVLTFNLGWLRPEENQHVSITLADSLALPDAVLARLGFDMDYENSLGFYDRSGLAPRTTGLQISASTSEPQQ